MKNKSPVYVIGAKSQLGRSLHKIRPEWTYIAREQLDLTDSKAIANFAYTPVIINFAAFTAVDDAEKKRDEAARLNHHAVGELSTRCEHFIHISTDYVFWGDKMTPYTETDSTKPVNFYGQTKLDGENAARQSNKNSIIIRTSWLYSEFNKNFVKTILRLAQERDRLRIVNDQIGTPTNAHDLVQMVATLAEQPAMHAGELFHFSNEGACSWYDFTREILRLKNIKTAVDPIASTGYPTPARRPAYSVLSKQKVSQATKVKIPRWQDSLALFLNKNF